MGDIGRLYLKEHNKANHRHTTHTSQVTKMKESKLCCTQKPDNSHSLQGALVIKKNNKVQSRIAGRKAELASEKFFFLSIRPVREVKQRSLPMWRRQSYGTGQTDRHNL